jgi:hypothetical protein
LPREVLVLPFFSPFIRLVFELGIAKFSADLQFMLAYVHLLETLNDDTNIRAVFEQVDLFYFFNRCQPFLILSFIDRSGCATWRA